MQRIAKEYVQLIIPQPSRWGYRARLRNLVINVTPVTHPQSHGYRYHTGRISRWSHWYLNLAAYYRKQGHLASAREALRRSKAERLKTEAA